MLPSIHFTSFLSAPQEQGSDDDDEEELTPAEVVQRMKVRHLCSPYLRPLQRGHDTTQVVAFEFTICEVLKPI